MRLTIYINQDKSFTVNAFDNDGFTAGALNTHSVIDAVFFIDSIRNKEPEAVEAKVVDHNGKEHQLSMISTRLHMRVTLRNYIDLMEEEAHA